MPDLTESLAKQRTLAGAPTLGNLHQDARAQAIARAGTTDLTVSEVRAQLQRMADAAGSQKSLARTLNVSEQYLSDVLLGRREIGPAITEALGLDVVVTFRPRGVAASPEAQPVGWQWQMLGSGNWAFCEKEKFAQACAESAGTKWRAVYAGPEHGPGVLGPDGSKR